MCADLDRVPVNVLLGTRGAPWGTAPEPASVAALVENPVDTDVFVCGPTAWAVSVEADALAAGVPAQSVHREKFAW